ncbi:hypothetical protein L6164_034069 [Bauhinia variegata]|uniref:Uncharacterized protein n=1 Tax=Bauhinia variegata TaxID=167791 RepID=A0ACB9KTQ2_BAUVA|nr:hypothetical protein L6164_034069 [Bauhinia variegata]
MDNIKAFILDLFMAGTDTSALTTEWAMAELINHPDGGKHTVDMQEKPGITLPRAHPLNCVPVPRLNPVPIDLYETGYSNT